MKYNKKQDTRSRTSQAVYSTGIGVPNEQSKNNPHGLQSLLASFMGGGGGDNGQNKVGGGGLGGMIGDVLGGSDHDFVRSVLGSWITESATQKKCRSAT